MSIIARIHGWDTCSTLSSPEMNETPMTPHIITTDAAEHYTWGEGCDGWFLVNSPDLTIIRERMPPGAAEIRHYHERAWQFFFVLEGTLSIELERKSLGIGVGQGVEIPPGHIHRVRNESDDDAVFLVTSRPDSHGDRIAVPE